MNWYNRLLKAAAPESVKHKHLLVRAEVKSDPKTPEELKAWIEALAEKIGMTIISGPHVEYVEDAGNRGFTTVSIIKTSHISLHVWDESDPALIQLDVYSCKSFNPREVFAHFRQFEPVRLSYKFLDREHGMHELNLGWTFKR